MTAVVFYVALLAVIVGSGYGVHVMSVARDRRPS